MPPLSSSIAARPVLPSFDDDASTVASTWTPALVSRWAPSKAPLLWMFVNTLLFVWSLLLVLEVLDVGVSFDSNYRLEESHWYLLWNFGTTFIWCLEVTLTVLSRAEEGENWPDSYLVLLELMLAIYFTSDSIRLFGKWRHASSGGDLDAELVDTIINTIAYFYLLLKAGALDRWVTWRGTRRDNYELIV